VSFDTGLLSGPCRMAPVITPAANRLVSWRGPRITLLAGARRAVLLRRASSRRAMVTTVGTLSASADGPPALARQRCACRKGPPHRRAAARLDLDGIRELHIEQQTRFREPSRARHCTRVARQRADAPGEAICWSKFAWRVGQPTPRQGASHKSGPRRQEPKPAHERRENGSRTERSDFITQVDPTRGMTT